MHAGRIRTAVAVLVASGLASGCALYSGTRDKQGQEAKEAWSKIDLKAQVDVPRKNLQALLEEQLGVEEQIWKTNRANLAEAMVSGWDLERFAKFANDGLARVAGDVDPAALRDAAAAVTQARGNLASLARMTEVVAYPLPTCDRLLDPASKEIVDDGVAKLPEANRALVKSSLSSAQTSCQRIATESAKLRAQGELGKAQLDLIAERDARDRQKDEAEAALAPYWLAVASYEQAAQALAADPTGSRAQVDEALGKLEGVAEELRKLKQPFAEKLVSEARLASLDRFLATYADVVAGKGTPEGSNRAAIALAVFPDLVDKARESLKDVSKPNLLPLVLQKNVEQVKLEAAQRDVDRRNRLVELRQAHVDDLLAQLEAYEQVLKGLRGPNLKSVAPTVKMRIALQPVASDAELDAKQALWKAVARYMDAEGRLRAQVGKTRYLITALEHEQALTYAESSINQWKALIDPSVDLIAIYGASGVRASDITMFLNSLTLLWIGVGVN